MMAINFEDLLERALQVAGDWVGVLPENCGDIRLNTNFGFSGTDAKSIEALIAAYNTGALDALAFLGELRRRGILDQDLDIEELATKAEEAKKAAADAAAATLEAEMKLKTDAAAIAAKAKPVPAAPGQTPVTGK